MLPTTFPSCNYHFIVNDFGPYRILFVSDQLVEQAKREQTTPFWEVEVSDKPCLDAVTRWIRFQRASWPAWGRLVEEQGREVLASHIADLMAADPPAESIAFIIEEGETTDQVALGELLNHASGLMKQIYYQHRFASAELAAVFSEWLLGINPEANGWALRELALHFGTDELGRRMDEIAADEAAKRSSAPTSAARE